MASSSDESIEEVRVTPEGWIYLIILAFISVGAVLRNVNLLILMAGMLCAPLIINWRMSVLWLKTLSGTRTLTQQLFVGKLASLQWTCSNDSRLTAWNTEIHDSLRPVQDSYTAAETVAEQHSSNENTVAKKFQIRKLLARFLGFRTGLLGSENVRLYINNIPPGRNATVSGRVMFFKRGRYAVGPAVVSTRFPFGLIASRVMLPKITYFHVAPRLGKLMPVWHRRIQSSVTGSDAVKRTRGNEEDEFYALRPWRSGDSRKHVHWRSSAKVGYPIVKQHEQQDNRDFAMLLDLDSFHDPANEKAEYDCETVLSFAATVLLQLKSVIHGRIAIGICGNRNTLYVSNSHLDVVQQCLRELAIVQSVSAPKILDTLCELHQSVSPSTPIFVISSRPQPEFAELAEFKGKLESESAIDNHLNRIWPSVNWLSVESPEFQEMFEAQLDAEQNQITSLTQAWMAENVTC